MLEVLVRKSQEEQAVAARIWQLQQEKAAMEANRRLREEQYAAEREREWEQALQREAELFRWAVTAKVIIIKQAHTLCSVKTADPYLLQLECSTEVVLDYVLLFLCLKGATSMRRLHLDGGNCHGVGLM